VDATGVKPLPFQLLVRQVGRDEEFMRGSRVKRIVRALYTLYGAQFRSQDMRHPALRLDGYPADDAQVALVKPTNPDR
jgi:hypothetical protein